MQRIAVFMVALLLSASTAFAGKWGIDKDHSNIGFAVSHLVISETTGKFNDFSATVESKKDDFTDASISFEASINSIDTDNEKRDGHLKSPDFFDAASHPKMTFKGKSLKKVSGKKYKLTGDLTIRGITKTVTLDVKFGGTVKDPWGNTRAGFHIFGEVNRFDFGLKWSNKLDTGGLVVGETVEISCRIELIKQA